MIGMRRDELKGKVCGWLDRGGIAAVGRSSIGADTLGGDYYKGG